MTTVGEQRSSLAGAPRAVSAETRIRRPVPRAAAAELTANHPALPPPPPCSPPTTLAPAHSHTPLRRENDERSCQLTQRRPLSLGLLVFCLGDKRLRLSPLVSRRDRSCPCGIT